jgi:hypothetical protein
MSVQRLLAKNNIVSKCLLFKFIVGRRQLGIQYVRNLCVVSSRSADRWQVFREKLFPVYPSFPSWKWLFAFSLMYAGYDSQSELLNTFTVTEFREIIQLLIMIW